MSAAAVALQDISEDDIDNLLEILKKETPFSIPAIYFIRMQRRWSRESSGVVRLQVLCPGGNWRSGQLVAFTSGLTTNNTLLFLAYSTPSDAVSLIDSIRGTPASVLPLRRVSVMAHIVEEPLISLMNQLLRDTWGSDPHMDYCDLFVMSAEKARNCTVPEIPAGVTVAPLDPARDEAAVCALWPHFEPYLLPLVRGWLIRNATFGAFIEGRLVSMAVENGYGALGTVQTDPQFRGRGLAHLLVTTMARDMGQRGLDVHMTVMATNTPSQGLMAKCDAAPPCAKVAFFSTQAAAA